MNRTNAQIQKEIKDVETYLERAERDIHLFDKGFIQHKRMRLEELKHELKTILK